MTICCMLGCDEPVGNGQLCSTHSRIGKSRLVEKSGIEATFAERGARYGRFNEHGEIAQALKYVMQGRLLYAPTNWDKLRPDMKEALDMIQHKVARILNGSPDYADSWHDIAGYAMLIEKRLQLEETK